MALTIEMLNLPTDPYFRLKYSWDMILCIEDFIRCINLHKTDLKSPRNTQLMNFMVWQGDKNFNPGGVLKDYIYLEANSFFQYAKKLKNEGKKMPLLPDYIEEIKVFRDKIVGHKDFREYFKSFEDWRKAHDNVNKAIAIDKLIKDVDDYYHEVLKNDSD